MNTSPAMSPAIPANDESSADKDERLSAIDAHVGARIRLRRTLLGLTQERLGEALGLTFQQVQKYERGANRVGASRLFDLARILEVPVNYFYDDLPSQAGGTMNRYGFAESNDTYGADEALSSRETLELVRAYYRITDPSIRKRVFELVKSMAPPD
jgi:transcriptional regulator with XRE-family HTH domain